MARILIEWRRAGQTYASEPLDVSGAADLSGACPSMAGLGGQARVTMLAGAAWIAVGANPVATSQNGRHMAQGERKHFDVQPGDKVSALEEAAGPGDPSAPLTATILNGASLSGAVDLVEQRLHRLAMPAGWDAASITFQVSYDGVTYTNLYTDTGEYTVSSAALSRSILVDQALFYGVRFLKVRSGTSGAAVNQTAQRDITLVTVPR